MQHTGAYMSLLFLSGGIQWICAMMLILLSIFQISYYSLYKPGIDFCLDFRGLVHLVCLILYAHA